MRSHLRTLVLSAILGGNLLSIAHADTIAYDGAGPGDSGWSAQWTAEPTTIGTGLAYPGILSDTGSFRITGTDMTRSLGSMIGGPNVDTTIWLSFIGYRATNTISGNNSANAFNVSLGTDTNDLIGVGGYRGTGDGDYTTTGSNNGGALDTPLHWAVTALNGTTRIGERTSVPTYSANPAGASFILLKIDYNVATGTDSLSLWINPSVAAGEAGLGLAIAQMNNLDLSGFDRVRLYAGSGATFNVDEIRLSSSFDTAIPEPSTYALLFGAGALGLVGYRRRRTRAS